MEEEMNFIVTGASDEEIEDLITKAVVQLVVDRINKLPQEQRMPTYEEVLRRLEEGE